MLISFIVDWFVFHYSLISSIHCILWWRCDMEILSTLLALCEGNPLVTSGLPSHRATNAEPWYCPYCQAEQAVDQTSSLQWFKTPWHSGDITVMSFAGCSLHPLYCNVCCPLFPGPPHTFSAISNMSWILSSSCFVDVKSDSKRPALASASESRYQETKHNTFITRLEF